MKAKLVYCFYKDKMPKYGEKKFLQIQLYNSSLWNDEKFICCDINK